MFYENYTNRFCRNYNYCRFDKHGFFRENGTKRWDAWRKGGKSMLDDFDKERKDLDNLMK